MAALRKLVEVQFARGEHHLASRPVDFIAVNVDVGKVVIGADFLNLTQCVLECMPVPQPDVLQSSLIVRRVSRLHGRLCRKLPLHDLVQSVGSPRQIGIVDNVRLLANQFVRFDDKAADIPCDSLNRDITDHGWKDRCQQPSSAWHPGGVDRCDYRAQNECRADDEHPGECDVRVRVGHTPENRMIVEQSFEPAQIDAHRED